MKYNSIGEYFYRLSNRCLALVLFPVVAILSAYLANQYFFTGLPWITPDTPMITYLLGAGAGVIITLFIIQAWLATARIKGMRVEPSLGKKITGYILIVLIRFRTFSLMILLGGTLVFLTGHLIFLILLPIPIVSILIYWPFRARMAKDLRLKPEENEILKNKNLGV